MLDKRCWFILNVINARCVNSGYTVFDLQELLARTPKHLGLQSKEIVVACIKTLAEREYVNVKYLDDDQVCLCPLPRGKYALKKPVNACQEPSKTCQGVFTRAFLGGLLGAIIPIALTILVLLVGGANA